MKIKYILYQEIDEKVAELHLAKVGATLTKLSDEQASYIVFLLIVPLSLMNIDIKRDEK